LIITTTVVGLPGLVWSLNFIKKRYGVSIEWVSSVKILISSSIAALATYFFVYWLSLSDPVELVLGVILYILVFIAVALVTRTINQSDIDSIRQIAGGLGPLRTPLTVILDLLERFMPKPKS
jgi:uncharacterized membrane protein YGL010W